MATRDPRSRDLPEPTNPGGDGVREPTQSLQFDPGDLDDPSPGRGHDDLASPLLALGTHNRPITAIESPAARGKTSPPVMPRPARGDPAEAYVGAVLGSYRVLELLGKGGMGYVFRAEHVKLGREVALKLLRNDYASRRDAVSRFFQEARTVNRVRHRNIIDVTDFVELDDGTTYIVMELLTGESLGAWAHRGVDLPRALAVLVQICDGLGAAHQVGVIHRDLKPDNVIVVPTPDGAELVKLLDFGVAKLVNRDDEDVGFQTAAGSVIGTPAYMSPEQAGGMVIDARSDIYSLGAIMYELFTGQPMFRGRSFGEYVRKHLTELPVPPHQTAGGAGIDPRLEALILRCLDKDPDQRFAHTSELREALLGLIGAGRVPIDPAAIPPQAWPAQPAAVLPRPLPLPAPISQVSAHPSGDAAGHAPGAPHGYLPPLTLSGEYSLPAAPPPAPRGSLWGWFAGAALAVALGVGAAIWYSGRPTPSLAPRTPPSTAPAIAASPAQPLRIEPPAPAAMPSAPAPPAAVPAPARPARVEVRFDARPSGGVFAEGQPAELCRTPCAFEIDPADGGPVGQRVFFVRRAGFIERMVTVDLTGGPREFQVALERAAATPVPRGDATRRPGRPARKAPARDAAAAKDAPGREPAPPPAEPEAKTPAAVPPIDPADTLDPFRKK